MDAFFSGLWQFVGSYWWLIFPLMGVAGGIGKSIEASAKRRHERRLETLRVKGEIKAAQIAARSGRAVGAGNQHPDATAPTTTDSSSSLPTDRELLERLFADHDGVTARWLDYELDVAKLIAFPAMSDGRQPLTAEFLRAKKTADALRPASADAKLSEKQLAEYLEAVGNYAVAFDVAERDARRLRDSSFTEPERKRLDRAQQLLKVAVDESATQAERNVAYKRVREEIDGLIALSDEAVEVLQKKVAPQLPSTNTSAPSHKDPGH